MSHPWQLRCPAPTGLVRPLPVGSAAGPTPSATKFGNWRKVGPNAYVPTGTSNDIPEQRILELSCLIPGSVVTGWAALRLHGANLCDGLANDGVRPLDVPLLGARQVRTHVGIDYRRQRVAPAEITCRHGIPCTTTVRAAADAMCTAADLREAVVWGDIACSAGLVCLGDLTEHLHRRVRTPGIVTARQAVTLVSGRSRSPAETRMRLIWQLDAGLPAPLSNWPVLTDAGVWVGAPDLLSPEFNVYGEYDGRDHRTRSRQATDAARDTIFPDLGLEGFRLVGRDIRDTGLVVARMRSAVQRAAESRRTRRWAPGDRPRPLA